MLLVSLIVVGLAAYFAERALPRYTGAIRVIALVLVALLFLRYAGVF